MSESTVQEYIDSTAARAELVAYLQQWGLSGASWHQRLSHWWDHNPCAAMHPLRGYIVRHEGKIVGYAGVIPSCYQINGEPVPALLATTLKVDDGHARAGLNILLKMRRLGEQVVFVHTTPVRRLQQVLTEMGARAQTRVLRRVLPLGLLSGLTCGGFKWPSLDASLHWVTDTAEVRQLAASRPLENVLQLKLTLDALRWQMAAPLQQLRLLGAADATGTMHSFLLLRQGRVLRGLRSWEVVQSWTSRETVEELWALIASLVHNPELLGKRMGWLATTSFVPDLHWRGLPCMFRHEERVCHFFLMPGRLAQVDMHTMLGEGDLLL